MKLFTCISEEEFKSLCVSGRLVCNHNHKNVFCNGDDNITEAYNWMANKLAEKDNPPIGVKYPRWAWYKFNGKPIKNVWKEFAECMVSDNDVVLELSIPTERCLLSSYGMWHCPLNGSYCPLSFDEEDYIAYHSKEDIVKSWDNCLVIMPQDTVQVVFWEILSDDVKRVVKCEMSC